MATNVLGMESPASQVRGAEHHPADEAYARLSRFEYDVFLSYSSQDRPYAAAIEERLRADGLRVFWDRDIASGALWRPALKKALEESQCVLVLWSHAARKSPWVQSEANLAQKLGVFQQARLEPLELDMPYGELQLIADLSTFDPREKEHEELERLARRLGEIVARPVAVLERGLAASQLRLLRRRRLQRSALRIAAPIALLSGILLTAGVFEGVTGYQLRLLSVWARGTLNSHRMTQQLTLVRIDQGTFSSLGKNLGSATWRSDVAKAIRNLAAEGAKVVVLDMTFQSREDASPAKQASTQELADAISAARRGDAKPERSGEMNTAVVVGVRGFEGKGPNVEPVVREALEQRGAGMAPGYLGVTCGGFEGGFATTFPVIVSPKNRPETLKSLGLAAILAEARAEMLPWKVGDDRLELTGQVPPLPLSGWGEARHTSSDCSIIQAGDRVAKVIIDQSFAQNPWQNAVVPFENAALGKLDAYKNQINQRMCLIGAELESEDRHQVFWRSDVPGVKLQADAITSLWNRIALRRLPPFAQLPLMLALGVLAALSRFLIPPQRWKLRAASVSALVALDVIFAVISAVYFDLFMDAEYHVLAILTSHWYAQRLEGRFIAVPRLEQGRMA